MFPLLLIGLIIGVVILAGCQCSGKKSTVEPSPQPSPVPQPVSASSAIPHSILITTKTLDAGELQRSLEILAQNPRPSKLSEGAMCYSMVDHNEVVTYICPVCMERTMYDPKNQNDGRVAGRLRIDVPQCRNQVKELSAIRARLDETAFCSHCIPKGGVPSLALVVQLDANGPEHRTLGITEMDLKILRAFIEGNPTCRTWNDAEIAIRNYTERISELLGLVDPLKGQPKERERLDVDLFREKK